MSSLDQCSTSTASIRSPEDEIILEKSAKLKQWVKNRMKELEDQNERLRLQNLRCTTQLQMLRSYSEKSRQLKEDMMSRSITGTLPVMPDSENRTSDDSGLTSDDTSDRRQMSTSMAGDMTPRSTRKPIRLRKESTSAENADKGSSTSDSSPWEERAKPIPTPRKTASNCNNNNINNNLLERDSLNSYADDYEFDVEDEIFDEIESPKDRDGNKFADYVNLADFVAIRDDKNLYSDIIKPTNPIDRPQLPEHRPRQWEAKLLQAAEKCLSITECALSEGTSSASPYHVSRLSNVRTDSPASRCSGSKVSATSSPRVLSFQTSSPQTPESHYAVRDIINNGEGDYYLPPDAARLSGDIRTSLIPSLDAVEKSGFWSLMSDTRLKSLKRRFVVLKNNQLSFYRKSASREEEPLMRIQISDVKSVTKIQQQGCSYAFQIITSSGKHTYMTENERTTQEWVAVLSAAVKGATLRDLASRCAPLDASISGIVTRVRCGHSRRVYAALVNHKLMFFKNPDDNVPSAFLYLQGARVSDKLRASSDDYSGSSDEQQLDDPTPSVVQNKKETYCICIEIANEDPVYLILKAAEEKEKWLYFLRSAAGDASLFGTPFEILVQRMLSEGADPDSPLWKDILLASCDDNPKDPLTTVEEPEKKKTLEISKACLLFVSVLMRPTAVQYHIDLAQNILSTTIQHDFLKNEFYAQLIRLTSCSMPYGLQGWKLMALALSLFLPKQYALLWLLKKHISRWMIKNTDEGSMAGYCKAALDRCLRMGVRTEGPSKMEVTSVLTRDPTTTKFPHSISVRLPNHQYQVVEFDGSTEIGQCLSSLCLKLGMRPALLSGYALYIDDPTTKGLQLLKGKQKVCDALSVWEQRHRDVLRGRIATDCAATLCLRQRHYWNHLVSTETPIERSFLVWRMADELVAGKMPLSNQLADQLAALYAQLSFGDCSEVLTDEQFSFITTNFYPGKMLDVACIKSLRASILANWREYIGMTEAESIRVILQVMRKWPLFGSDIYSAGMRTCNDKKIFLALSDTAIHIIDQRHFDVIRSIAYHRLTSFGAFHNDFMLMIDRLLPADSHPEETPKERITFSMDKCFIDTLTLHLAEYIRCQKLVWKVSK
ncbi:unnamed protein product [Auanema sp. JU1783]|nr:unnamed protein product [Auanema sp. JU1783]